MEILRTHMLGCATLTGTSAALDLIECLRSCGSTMLIGDYGPIDKRPERKIDSKGNIIGGEGIEHPLLGKSRSHNKIPEAPKHEHGTGCFSYIRDDQEFTLSQSVEGSVPAHWDEVADGQMSFARMIYPRLRPRFGWIDEFGDSEATIRLVRDQPRVLFWANIYGPESVKQLGKAFLVQAPGWKKEELDDGGILYVITSQFHEWYANPSDEALRYFRKKIPDIRAYRAKPVDLPDEVAGMVVTDDATGNETVVYERGDRQKRRGKTQKNDRRHYAD